MSDEMVRVRLSVYGGVQGVDRAGWVLRGVSAMQAVEALGHRAVVDGETLRGFVGLANGMRNGVKSRFTHPGLSSDGLGKFLGRMRNFRVAGDKAVGDLHLSAVAARSPHGDLRAYVADLAEEDPEAFGMSAVMTAKRVWVLEDGSEVDDEGGRPAGAAGELPVFRVRAVHAVDVVDEPAANRGGMFGAFSGTTSELAADVFGVLDAVLADYGDEAMGLVMGFVTQGRTGDAWLDAQAALMMEEYGIELEMAQDFVARYWGHRQARPRRRDGELVSLAVERPDVDGEEGDDVMSQDEKVVEGVADAAGDGTQAESPAFDAWQEEARLQVVTNMLAQSGLPEVVQRRLARQGYADPLGLRSAIRQAQGELEALREELGGPEVIDLPARPRRGTQIEVADGLALAQGHLDWFFGVESAPLPPGNMRSLRDLYWALTGDFEWYGKFVGDQVQLAGATTTTLPEMALNACNKVIAMQWSRLRYYRWYELVATVAPNDGSVNDMQWISFGGVADLPVVGERESYSELAVDDVRESDPFSKYGGFIGITLEMMRNSNLVEIQAVPRALAVASLRTRSAKIAGIFTANSGVGPTLRQDSKALFHTDHNNLATTALGTDTSAWEAASQQCFDHTEVGSGKKLAAFAKFCLTPSTLYFQALKNFGYGDGNPTTYNPFAVADRAPEDPRPVVLPVPEWTDANDWAYLVDPMLYPVIMMSYGQAPGGNAHPLPELFTVPTETGLLFSNDTLPIKVRDWFSYGVNGYRGIGKRNVT